MDGSFSSGRHGVMGPDPRAASTGAGDPRRAPVAQLDAVVFDLDGVLRHYDRERSRQIERRYDLEENAIFRAAFGGPFGRVFMCGQLDHDQFAAAVGDLIGSVDAVAEFLAARAVVDDDAVALVREVRRQRPVALLTNGSLRTRLELEEVGLSDAFDAVFNSAETGVLKPDAAAYQNVLRALDVNAHAAAFVDDHPPNVAGAASVGLIGHHFLGLDALRVFLRSHGLSVPDQANMSAGPIAEQRTMR